MHLSRPPRPAPARTRRRHRLRAGVPLAALLLAGAALSGCSAGGGGAEPDDGDADQGAAAEAPQPRVEMNVADRARDVPVDTRLQVSVADGQLEKVVVRSEEGTVPGTIAGEVFTAEELLEPGARYRVRTVVRDGDGERVVRTSRFSTADLSLDEQTFASVAPLDGETVGVGMPVVVTFDLPVKDPAAFERHMSVTSEPQQTGSWHWISEREARWRPARYWQPGTTVDVDVDINSVPAGGGIYGQESRRLQFEVGDKHVYKVDARTHRMKVLVNDELVRTMPITTGKEGFTTRSGVKVVMEKSPSRRMRSETVGIAAGSADSYDIDNVQWAMRLTTSGEFIHAAPWSVGSQGRANVSHGCTGMSTSDAGWLYDRSQRGDVVVYTGTDRPMTVENGWGDWNLDFADYRAGSALS